MSYDLLTMQKAVDKANGNDVLFEELGNNSPSLAGLLLETIYKKDKPNCKSTSGLKLRYAVYPERYLYPQRQILFPYGIEKQKQRTV